ncbi:MAG: hypothetical protein BJBARM4_0916 [Candidatus Parvarchaeum acidiphilum ARMAN-4]|jgi:hypothetical protein|uniref:Uncharacterized protein n=1 Tax=Candidatus Parvarchaeum acidiphilum ARMAN-4 TaxID=662760 RepID=D2EGL7_PARA4|nr:MAG: hypothetical protein BJBARM4_0916 [Candidatus Parvarchaeum acidiphilum ARMAN-4]
MKIGIIMNSNDPETVWNALRFGIKALDKKDGVKISFYDVWKHPTHC